MEMGMESNHPPPPPPHPPAAGTTPTTETYQKHYGRGAGYPGGGGGGASRGGPPPPPPPPHGYPSPYAPPGSPYAPPGGPHAHAPPPPHPPYHHPSHHAGAPRPPPHHGGYPPPPPPPAPWYYPPSHDPSPRGGTRDGGGPPPSSGAAAARRPGAAPPPVPVTPKSRDHDAEAPPPAAAGRAEKKKDSRKAASKAKGREGGKSHLPGEHKDVEPEEEEEELQVKPMKQDFHFWVEDHREEHERACQIMIDDALAKGTVPPDTAAPRLRRLLYTLVNARLIRDWEAAPPATRAAYLKREEADRKRFMGEEEVASRHCATLTARRRSPKQTRGLGATGSFGLAAAVEVAPPGGEAAATGKRAGGAEGEGGAGDAKRAKVMA